jgi:regulator of replication initiation timing
MSLEDDLAKCRASNIMFIDENRRLVKENKALRKRITAALERLEALLKLVKKLEARNAERDRQEQDS